MGRSTSKIIKPILGQTVGDILGTIVDPLQIEKNNYEKKQMENAVKKAAQEQRNQQQKLINQEKEERDRFEKQQALTSDRAIEESGYAREAAGGVSTILNGAKPEQIKLKKNTLLGSFLK